MHRLFLQVIVLYLNTHDAFYEESGKYMYFVSKPNNIISVPCCYEYQIYCPNQGDQESRRT